MTPAKVPLDPAGHVASPCNNVCTLHEPSGWCRGCLRTLAEITAWATMTDADKRGVWQALPARRVAWRAWRAGRDPSTEAAS